MLFASQTGAVGGWKSNLRFSGLIVCATSTSTLPGSVPATLNLNTENPFAVQPILFLYFAAMLSAGCTTSTA